MSGKFVGFILVLGLGQASIPIIRLLITDKAKKRKSYSRSGMRYFESTAICLSCTMSTADDKCWNG